MIFAHALLALGISIFALLISIVIDALLAPLPFPVQFMLQIPAIVLVLDAFRQWLEVRVPEGIDINAVFFLAAPMAAFAAKDLFKDLRRYFY